MRKRTEWVALLIILTLAAVLRLAGGADNPGWYADEGTHVAIAQQLLAGRVQYLAVGDSTLLFARLPLFPGLLAALLAATGAGPEGDPARGLAVLRALTGSLGVLAALALYGATRRLVDLGEHYDSPRPFSPKGGLGVQGPERLQGDSQAKGRWLPLAAALVYALYPPAIVYSRFGFSYNLLAPLGLLVFWGAGEALHAGATGRDLTGLASAPTGAAALGLAALALGVGALADLWMWVLLPPLLAAAAWWARPRGLSRGLRAVAPVLLLTAGPSALYALHQALTVPAAFAFDLRFTLGRLGALSPSDQVANVLGNLATLTAQDGWVMLGLVGLFVLRPARLAGLALLFVFVPLVLLGRTTALYSLSYYYLIPLLPFVALGCAGLVLALSRLLAYPLTHLRTLFFLLLALGTLATDLSQLRAGFPTAIDPFLLAPADARAAAAYVNARREPGDLVLASPGLAWLLPGETADFQMALAYAGLPTPHVPADLPRVRYRFSAAPERARFVVVDNLWRNWGLFNVGGLAALLDEVERWPVAFRAGEVAVYARPAVAKPP